MAQIKDLIRSSYPGIYNQKYIELKAEIEQLFLDFNVMSPSIFLKKYHYDDNKIKNISVRLFKEFPLIDRFKNNATESINITQLNNFKYMTFKSGVTKTFNLSDTHKFEYRFDWYKSFNDFHISMLISKYDISSLSDLHIKFYCFYDMYDGFINYKEGCGWLINQSHMYKQYENILSSDISYFSYSIKSILGIDLENFKVEKKKTEKKSKKHHYTANEIIEMFEYYATINNMDYLDMTQTDKKKAIMQFANCGKTTASNYMQEYKFSDYKYIRKDLRDIKLRLDSVENNIINNDNNNTESIHKHIEEFKSDVSEQIQDLKDTVQQCVISEEEKQRRLEQWERDLAISREIRLEHEYVKKYFK